MTQNNNTTNEIKTTTIFRSYRANRTSCRSIVKTCARSIADYAIVTYKDNYKDKVRVVSGESLLPPSMRGVVGVEVHCFTGKRHFVAYYTDNERLYKYYRESCEGTEVLEDTTNFKMA